MPKPNERFVAELNCHHFNLYFPRPDVGDTVYCRACNDFREVISSHAEWSYKCPTCKMSRAFGLDETGVFRQAQKHAVKYPGHTVSVCQGAKIVQKINVQTEHTTDILDFLRQNPAHQSALRSLSNRDRQQGVERVDLDTAPGDGGNEVRSLAGDAQDLH